jgi:hypothetical protein
MAFPGKPSGPPRKGITPAGYLPAVGDTGIVLHSGKEDVWPGMISAF